MRKCSDFILLHVAVQHHSHFLPAPLIFFLCCVFLPPLSQASLVAQRLKHLPAVQETYVQSLGQEDPLEKEMPIHPSILAWKIPWTEEPSGLQSTWSQRVRQDWAISLSLSFCHRLIDHMHMSLFLGSLFYSTDLCIFLCSNVILFWWL